MNTVKYDVTFEEAIKLLLQGEALKGDNFRKGYFIKLNYFGQIVLVSVADFYREDTMVCLKSLSK